MGRNDGAGREEVKYKKDPLRVEAVKQEPPKTIKLARRAPNPSSLSLGRKEALPEEVIKQEHPRRQSWLVGRQAQGGGPT